LNYLINTIDTITRK